jgi:hypothetical protein
MIAAAGELDIDEVERHVDAGANINALGEFDDTALTTVIQAMGREAGEEGAVNGGEDVVSRFLGLGADVNLFGYDGVDPLISATLSAAPAIVETLLSAGADPNHNAWPDDEPDLISSALSYASCDGFLHKGIARVMPATSSSACWRTAGAVVRRPQWPRSAKPRWPPDRK